MQNLAVNGYTRAQVIAALHASAMSRKISFRHDLLDQYDRKIKALTTVEDATISCTSNANIQRAAKFFIHDDPDIDYASNRIQPFIRFQMSDGGFAEWSQGIYLLSSPERIEQAGVIYRNIDAYDGNQALVDDKLSDRLTIASGTNYVTAIKARLTAAGITKINIQTTTLTNPADKEWPPGTSQLTIVNALLAEINYIPLYVDEIGYYTSRPYVSPANRSSEYTYEDDPETSIIYNGLIDRLDTFGIANKFVVYTSNPDSTSLRSVYTNTSVTSPLSTVNRGRTITDFRQVTDIADQTTLDDYVERLAFEASQVYGYVTAETAIMPMHSVDDLVTLNYSAMSIYGKFSETSWSMQLRAGAKMKHSFRRTVSLI